MSNGSWDGEVKEAGMGTLWFAVKNRGTYVSGRPNTVHALLQMGVNRGKWCEWGLTAEQMALI